MDIKLLLENHRTLADIVMLACAKYMHLLQLSTLCSLWVGESIFMTIITVWKLYITYNELSATGKTCTQIWSILNTILSFLKSWCKCNVYAFFCVDRYIYLLLIYMATHLKYKAELLTGNKNKLRNLIEKSE